MKRLVLLLSVLLLSALSGHAQTRVLLGGGGGSMYSNISGGVIGGLEVPVGKHFEIDGEGQLSLEKKLNLGTGWAYNYGVDGILWANHAVGFDGGIQQSAYSVTATGKTENFVNAGIVYRRLWFGVPTRFTFNYVQEIANGILPNGDETNHLQGGLVSFDSRIACFSAMCLRFRTTIEGGKILNQGNPVCDGTFGNTGGPKGGPCPRTASSGGGANFALLFEFPRRRSTENDPF